MDSDEPVPFDAKPKLNLSIKFQGNAVCREGTRDEAARLYRQNRAAAGWSGRPEYRRRKLPPEYRGLYDLLRSRMESGTN